MLIHVDSISENSDSRETDALVITGKTVRYNEFEYGVSTPSPECAGNSFPHISLEKTRPELTEIRTHIVEGHLLFIRQLKPWLKVYPVKSVFFFFQMRIDSRTWHVSGQNYLQSQIHCR